MSKKKTNPAEIVIIIDRSGSMAAMGNEVVGGINSALEAAKEDPASKVTLVMFNTNVVRKYDRVPASDAALLKDADYTPDGMTALLDAVGQTINAISVEQKKDKPSKTLVTIITDGYENASQEYTYRAIANLISKKEKEGWEFVFMGANIDAVAEAEKIGIRRERAAKWAADGAGIKAASAAMARTVRATARNEEVDESALFTEIEADWARRG